MGTMSPAGRNIVSRFMLGDSFKINLITRLLLMLLFVKIEMFAKTAIEHNNNNK